MRNGNVKGALLALAGFCIFASHDVLVKYLGAIYSPVQIVFFAVLMGFPLITVMLIRDAKDGNLRPRHPWWMALRTVAAVITGLSAFYAFSRLPLAQTYAIIFATPLLITVLSIPILGETVRLRRWLAVLVGLCGVMVVLQPSQTKFELGHLAALSAAIFGALASIVVRKIGQEERSAVLLLYPMMANFIVMGALLPLVYKPMPGLHLAGFTVIAACALIAMLFIIWAYRSAEAVIVAPMQYSQIIWATLFGMLFFDETPQLNTAVGAGIIIASGLYILFRESTGNVSQNTPVLRTRNRPETGTYPRIGPMLRRIRSRE